MLTASAAAETIKVAICNIENFTEGSRTAEELSLMADLVDILDADVIALQEVDGPEAAQLIFDPTSMTFTSRRVRTSSALASRSGEDWRSRRTRTSLSSTSAGFATAPT